MKQSANNCRPRRSPSLSHTAGSAHGCCGRERRFCGSDAGAKHVADRVRMDGGFLSAKGVAYLLAYLSAFVGLIIAAQPVYGYRVFLPFDMVGIDQDGWPSFFVASVVVLTSFAMGVAYLVGECGGFHDVLLAALSSSAATGAYLACYTLLNPVVCIAFLAAVIAVVVRATMRRGSGFYVALAQLLWILLAVLGFVTCAAWGWAASAASFDVEYPESFEGRRLAEHIDTAALFFDEDAWSGMSLAEKASALGEMVLVECNYLGIREPPSVSIAPCPGTVIASYCNEDNLITFNPGYLVMPGGGEVAIEAAAHECAHRYQAECVERGYALSASESGWASVPPSNENVAMWAEEFEDYTPSSEDFRGYREQDCERSAEAYGLSALLDIGRRVEKYERTGVADA